MEYTNLAPFLYYTPPEARELVFPCTFKVNERTHLEIGGCDTVELAKTYGTPMYLFDEETIREKCREYVRSFQEAYPNTQVLYASKAYIGLALASILNEEGLGLDVVSEGELHVAAAAGFPLEKVYFHGNNKSAAELSRALQLGVGRVVVDNFQEMETLDQAAGRAGQCANVLLRISPGVDTHTHEYRKTGILDSKFGFALETGDAEKAVAAAIRAEGLGLKGLHAHVGSQIFETEPFVDTVEILLTFARQMRDKLGFQLEELSPGGGWGVPYVSSQPSGDIAPYVKAVSAAVKTWAAKLDLPLPRLTVEPGRSIIAPAGVAIYTVGAIKDIPGVRRYVSVDGGMADNIRPALYGSQYEAVVANKMEERAVEVVTIAGKFCESGDVLIKDIALPPVVPGDLIAVPVSGAYSLPMASNYNMALRPPIVLVKDGQARLIRRRETYDDLLRCDLA